MRIPALLALSSACLFAVPAVAQVHVAPVIGLDHLREDGRGMSGIAYGIAGGMDYSLPIGPFVGVEGEVAGSSADRCVADTFAIGDTLCREAGRDLYVGARAGVSLAGTRIYGKLGYANARIREEYTPTATAASFVNNRDRGGLRLGAGVEFAPPVLPVFLRGEYRHTAYGEDLRRNQLMAAAGLRF